MYQRWLAERRIRGAEGTSTSWELLYADPHDGSDGREAFRASRLIVDGEPARGKPDVVLRDRQTGIVVVLERKVTTWRKRSIPEDGWPNIRAQLWCYSWMDQWANAPDGLVVCHFWQRRVNWGEEPSQDSRNPWILTVVRPAWRRSDSQFHVECLEYFREYGGTFVQGGNHK